MAFHYFSAQQFTLWRMVAMRAKNLKYLRNKFEMNQTTFAKKLNIAQNTLSEYENGIRPIPDTVAQSVAYLCRTSVHDFTYVDLSACDYLFSAQNGYIPDLTLIAHAINTLFPIVDSSNTDDTSFHMGHEKLVELQNRFNTIQTIEWEEMTDCLQLFQDSWNSHKNESALANCICTIFMMCTSYYAPKNKQENKFICAIKKTNQIKLS